MTDTNTPPTPESEKKGRGPTRPAVKAADLIDDVAKSDIIASFVLAVGSGLSAKDQRAAAKTRAATLKKYVALETKSIEDEEQLADFLERAESLPDVMRRFVVASLAEPAPAPQ